MTTITITPNDTINKSVFAKIDETGDNDVVVEAIASETKPEDGDGFWWKKVNDLQFGGIWANGRTEATITIDDDIRISEVN